MTVEIAGSTKIDIVSDISTNADADATRATFDLFAKDEFVRSCVVNTLVGSGVVSLREIRDLGPFILSTAPRLSVFPAIIIAETRGSAEALELIRYRNRFPGAERPVVLIDRNPSVDLLRMALRRGVADVLAPAEISDRLRPAIFRALRLSRDQEGLRGHDATSDQAKSAPQPTGQSQSEGMEDLAKAISEICRYLHQHGPRAGDCADVWRTIADLFEEGSMICVSDLALDLGVPISSVSRMVDRLVTDGWLVKKRDSRDSRRVLVSMSEGGRGMAIRAFASLDRAKVAMYFGTSVVGIEGRRGPVSSIRSERPAGAGVGG